MKGSASGLSDVLFTVHAVDVYAKSSTNDDVSLIDRQLCQFALLLFHVNCELKC